jgi:outer membrane protein OmpA-like peptidoglycan-associated protein
MSRENRLIDIACAAALAYAFSFSAPAAVAGEATYLSNQASYCEIFQAINPNVPDDCRAELGATAAGLGQSRSIKLHQATNAAAKAATPAAQGGPQAMAMNIPFEFDSAELTPQALAILDRVASVLNSELMADTMIVVEGHTDAIGSDDYNLALSTQRALAVQFYLVEQHLIDLDRLEISGRGERELYDPSQPDAALNRRVEFINLNS